MGTGNRGKVGKMAGRKSEEKTEGKFKKLFPYNKNKNQPNNSNTKINK